MAVIANVGWQQCRDMGGTQVNCRNVIGSCGLSYCPPGSMTQICDCFVPDAAPAPAPATVPAIITVSPVITASPQISPVFQQQFQPSNSPATATASQASAQPSVIETVPTFQPTPQAAPVAVPVQAPASASDAYSIPAPMPAYGGGPIGPGPDLAYPPSFETALQTSVGAQSPAQTSPEKKNNTLLFLGMGVLGLLLIAGKRKRISHAT